MPPYGWACVAVPDVPPPFEAAPASAEPPRASAARAATPARAFPIVRAMSCVPPWSNARRTASGGGLRCARHQPGVLLRAGACQNRRVAGRLPRAAFGALAGAGAAAAYGWRRLFRAPLPQTRGTLHVKGLEGPLTIERDRFGVPRIEARSDVDVCFALGFCQAQDRGWQLEFFRRAAWGRTAEWAGPPGLQTDRLMRTFGMRRVAEREAAELDADTRGLPRPHAP